MSGVGQWWQCVASFSARWSVTAVASVTTDQCPVLGRGQITGANNDHSLQPTARRDILHLQSYSATEPTVGQHYTLDIFFSVLRDFLYYCAVQYASTYTYPTN